MFRKGIFDSDGEKLLLGAMYPKEDECWLGTERYSTFPIFKWRGRVGGQGMGRGRSWPEVKGVCLRL